MQQRYRQTKQFLIAISQMSRLAWRCQPIAFVIITLLDIVQGLVPLGMAWLTKQLFDLLSQGTQTTTSEKTLWPIIVILIAQTMLIVFSYLLELINKYLKKELGRQLTSHVQKAVYRKISGFAGLRYFEDPAFYDTLTLASRGAEQGPMQTMQYLFDILRGITILVSFFAVLLAFNSILLIVVTIAILPQLYIQIKIGQQRFNLAAVNTPQQRQMSYYGTLLSDYNSAKEIRLFGLGDWLLTRLLQILLQFHEMKRYQDIREIKWQFPIYLLSKLIASGAFIFIAVQAVRGSLSIGDVTLYMGAVSSVQGTLSHIIFACTGINENVLFYRQYMRLMGLPSDIPAPEAALPVPSLSRGIELRNVSFRYAESRPWVLRHVNLFIPAGQSVALVGLNGAGKTTLVKLLTRLYDVTEGEILWDGTDIRCFEPIALRQQMGAIFQDFVRYNLTMRENIGLGDVTHLTDEARIQQAARQAKLTAVIEQLPRGYDTVLSRWLVDDADAGGELSGGQWQKVALARLFMRDAAFYVLDEPTAALDAQAEHDLYNQFVELVNGRTSLIISHRFSTVKMADCIAVLDDGRIIEHSSHEELLAMRGHYARLYTMQAEKYQ